MVILLCWVFIQILIQKYFSTKITSPVILGVPQRGIRHLVVTDLLLSPLLQLLHLHLDLVVHVLPVHYHRVGGITLHPLVHHHRRPQAVQRAFSLGLGLCWDDGLGGGAVGGKDGDHFPAVFRLEAEAAVVLTFGSDAALVVMATFGSDLSEWGAVSR